MSQSICWLPGWASDFSLWRSHIETRWPNADHRFLPYSELVTKHTTLAQHPWLQQADLIVGWSLGSLLALQAAPLLPPGQPLVAVCPIAWFCHPELGWPTRVLQKMSTRLKSTPRVLLETFAQQMGAAPQEQQAAWVEHALQLPMDQLQLGLELLATQVVSQLGSIAMQRPVHLVAGGMDEVISPELAAWLEEEMQPTSFQALPEMSHWPFSADWSLPVS